MNKYIVKIEDMNVMAFTEHEAKMKVRNRIKNVPFTLKIESIKKAKVLHE